MYTDSNYVLLGEILEVVTGTDAAAAINASVVECPRVLGHPLPSPGEVGIPEPRSTGIPAAG